MQKAQDLHIKHLYAIGEDQDSVANSSDVLPEITVNEIASREDSRWYRKKTRFSRTFAKLARNFAAKEGILKEGDVSPTV